MKTGTTEYLKIDDIMDIIKDFAGSHGLYSRIYAEMLSYKQHDPDAWQAIAADLEAQKFTDVLDVIMFIES